LKSLRLLSAPFRKSLVAVPHALLACSLLAAFLAAGCQRPEEDKVDYTISFDRIADSLEPFEEVVIVLKSLDGDTVERWSRPRT
jgi:hypothetical protein